LTSALDITQAVRPPRSVFVNYPLGHTCGKPGDPIDQRYILSTALGMLETAKVGEIKRLNVTWGDEGWDEHFPKR
jgi:hypothetical protein